MTPIAMEGVISSYYTITMFKLMKMGYMSFGHQLLLDVISTPYWLCNFDKKACMASFMSACMSTMDIYKSFKDWASGILLPNDIQKS